LTLCSETCTFYGLTDSPCNRILISFNQRPCFSLDHGCTPPFISLFLIILRCFFSRSFGPPTVSALIALLTALPIFATSFRDTFFCAIIRLETCDHQGSLTSWAATHHLFLNSLLFPPPILQESFFSVSFPTLPFVLFPLPHRWLLPDNEVYFDAFPDRPFPSLTWGPVTFPFFSPFYFVLIEEGQVLMSLLRPFYLLDQEPQLALFALAQE